MPETVRLTVIGANGRVGRLLQAAVRLGGAEGLVLSWVSRAEWDILTNGPAPLSPCDVMIDLTGVTSGKDVNLNPRLAEAVAVAAKTLGARLIFVSSAGVYPGGPHAFSEGDLPAPKGAYGQSKLAAEQAVREVLPQAMILRLGNVAGADAVLAGQGAGPVLLDQTDDGRGPVRSYIGPETLARALFRLVRLSAQGATLPQVLNLAEPGAVAMADLLDAAQRAWDFHPDRQAAVPCALLDTSRIVDLFPMPPANPHRMVNELHRLAPHRFGGGA